MARKIKISCGDVEVTAELYDNSMADEIWENLPLSGRANTWGDEIYFSVPVKGKDAEMKAVVEVGELGYWDPGSAFCIFFGPTPVSSGNEPRPADPVRVFGMIEGDPKVLKSVPSGTEVVVEQV